MLFCILSTLDGEAGRYSEKSKPGKGSEAWISRQLSALKFPKPEKWVLLSPPGKGVVRSSILHGACHGGYTRDAM